MKTVLILCLATLAGTTSWSLNERASSVPTGVQRQKPRQVLVLPRTGRRDMQRLFYLKHLLELNCLRHICNGGASCKGSRCPAALKSTDRNQYRSRMRADRFREPPLYLRRGYPSDTKMIVVPPNIYFVNPRMENLSQMTQNLPNGGKLVKQNTDNIVYIHFPQHNEDTRPPEDQPLGEKSSNGDDMQKSASESFAKSKATTAHSYWQEPPPDQVRQYEVKEVVDEDPTYQEGNPFYVIQKATEEALAEEFQNRSDVSDNDRNNNSTKETVRNFSNEKSRQFVEEKTPQTRQEEARYIKITPTARHPYNRVQKTQTTEQPTNIGTTPTVTTGKKRPDMSALPSDLLESLEFLTDQPETDKSTPDNRKSATMSFSEIQTTANVVSKSLRELITTAKTDSDTEWTFPEDSNTSPSMVNMVKTVEYFSEETINKADLTTPDFQEFSDHPLVFDLLPKAKPKDTDTAWKNSRKMHFGDTPKTSKPHRDEQRRSDILINENDDYYDYENNFSTSNYLEKLKENSSLASFDLPENPSPDEIIPLIPVVISDLREDKIPQESLPALSELFGKYWPSVLALSNSTNLDMLPLLKMKNEKDLESILESVLPENSEQATTTTNTTENTEFTKNLYLDWYEYDADNYRDVYRK